MHVVLVENTANKRTRFVYGAAECFAVKEVAGVPVLFVIQAVADHIIKVSDGAAFAGDSRLAFGIAKARFDNEPLTAGTAITLGRDAVIFFYAHFALFASVMAVFIVVMCIEGHRVGRMH